MEYENKFANTDVQIHKGGTQIVLPKDPKEMTTREAIETLQRLEASEETKISIHEEVQAFPLEGAFALMRALKRIYGWADAVPKPSFFGPIPPTMVNLEIAPGVHTQVIWGQFNVPNVSGRLETSQTRRNGRPIFVISGTVKKKEQQAVKRVADLTRQIVSEESIYRGKAIKLRTDDDGQMDFENPPAFIDTTRVDERELVFSEELTAQVKTNLFTPIERTAQCRQHHVPLKRGILLEGKYGTGKTLTAFVTAKKCEANGWTFIMLDKVGALKEALLFARMYAPAVVFAEDIDRSVEGERSVEMDDILNTIDGVDSKGAELITILTSNHVENINKAMLRPGRLDAVLSIIPPDAKAAERLIRLYSHGLVLDSEDVSDAGQELAGQIPAVIREVVERSKLHAIGRLEADEDFLLSGEDLLTAAKGMKTHLALMNPPATKDPTAGEKLAEAMGEIVSKQLPTKVPTNVRYIKDKVDEIAANQ